MKKFLLTTTQIIFLISLLLGPLIFLVSTAQAADGFCCEITYNSGGGGTPCGTGVEYRLYEKESDCINLISQCRDAKIAEDASKCAKKKIQIINNLPDLKLNAPDLKVTIPGADKLESVTCTESSCSIPWLAKYIVGLQKYAIGAVGILAAIVMMFGGVLWLTAGGNSKQIEDAKTWIVGGLTGLLLVFGSYLILYTINPKLTVLDNINLKRIGKIDLENLFYDGHWPMFDPKNAKPITDTTYDETFKNFADCLGIDWRIMKSIAYKESGLNPTVVNEYGFTGLFQTKTIYCAENLRKLNLDVKLCDNPGITDPFVNTAIATGMMKMHKKVIDEKCGSAPDSVKIFLIYFGNANGNGALQQAIGKYGCNVDAWPEGKPPKGVFNGATKKYNTEVVETALAQGVTSFTNTSGNGKCPEKK
jgi:hypothetical protein